MKLLYPIIILILVAFIVARESCNESKLQSLKSELSIVNLQKQSLTDSLKNKNNQIIKLQDAVVFEGKKGKYELSKYADSIFNLKKKDERKYKETIAFYETYIATYLPDTLYVPFNDSNNVIGSDTLKYLENSIAVPKSFEKIDTFFQIKGTVKKTGVDITHINLPDSIRGRFIEKKNGWFKSPIIEYQITNTNPYIKINNSKSAIYKPPKKTFWKKVGEASLLIGIGFIISQSTN